MDYNIKKTNKILYCILDNIENIYSTHAQEVARNVSDFLLSLLIRRGYDIVIDQTSDRLLRRAANDNFYSHAVVMITGTHTALSEGIFLEIEKKCKESFAICGHILDRGSSYYEIHNQFFIVNLDEYRNLGCPNIGDVEWNSPHEKLRPIRSQECLYQDNELPVWIKQGSEVQQYQHKRHGWNLFEVALRNNAVLCDVGEAIRDKKNYLYYEYDHVFYKHLPDLFNYNLICNTMVTPWNSDLLSDEIIINETQIDHYISTGTGLNWIYNLQKLGFHNKTKVTFIDISYSVLLFMKKLVTEWDGKDYAEFYMTQMQFVPVSYDLDLTNHKERIKNWFVEFEKNFENFQALWNDIKSLEFNYVLTDFFAPTNFDFISDKEITFMNVSDAFNHVPYAHYAPVKYRVSRENNLIHNLQKIHPDLWLYIPCRLGQIYKENPNSNETINFDRAKNFTKWDINEFRCPPWQQKNWKSLCPLTDAVRILG